LISLIANLFRASSDLLQADEGCEGNAEKHGNPRFAVGFSMKIMVLAQPAAVVAQSNSE
jgi:hypothetical protein